MREEEGEMRGTRRRTRGRVRDAAERERSKAEATKVYAVTLSHFFETNTIPNNIIIQSSLVRESAAEP